MQKQWRAKPEPDKKTVEALSSAINVNKVLSGILVQRGVDTFEKAKNFFRPQYSHMHSPFIMKGMTRAIERIDEALAKNQKILIYGDYDVDGTTSVATVYDFFSKRFKEIEYYIPDRYTEGYGISFMAIDWASNNGYSLIIALDCGIKANDKVKYANKKGVDFIICDHHLPGDELPEAVAILNPKQADCPYPFKELSGCGIGLKLVQGYCVKHEIDFKEVEEYMDLSAISVASDLVPIMDENRVITYQGLKNYI
jgi:single-stranded-DNA-specific exonuclease